MKYPPLKSQMALSEVSWAAYKVIEEGKEKTKRLAAVHEGDGGRGARTV